MPVKTKCIYDEPEAADGYRLLVMRLWPRGVRKEAADAWEKELGAPVDLIRQWKNDDITWAGFSRRYLVAMREQKDKIGQLAKRAGKETITLLCGCRDENRCHRILLKKLIEEAQ